MMTKNCTFKEYFKLIILSENKIKLYIQYYNSVGKTQKKRENWKTFQILKVVIF